MFIYFFNYFLIFFFLFISKKYYFKKFSLFFWSLLLFYFFLFVGLRFEVSPDWVGYQNIYDDLLNKNNISFIFDKNQDYLYFLLNQVSILMEIGLVGVNFIISFIFFIAFYFYTKNFSNKYLALFVSYPIVIIVLQMGYVRQGLAFSFFLLMLYNCQKKNYFYSFFFLILAILSHKSSLIFLPVFILKFFNDKSIFGKKIYYNYSLFIFFFLFFLFIIFFFKNIFNHFFIHYVLNQETYSFGSLVRGLLILVISFIFLKFGRNTLISSNEFILYSFISYLVFFLFFIIFFAPIVGDRLLLYFQVLSIFFLGNLNLKNNLSKLIGFSILFAYKFYFLIWIFYGVNTNGYIPYKSIFYLIGF